MRRGMVVASMLAGLGLGAPAGPVAAQSRVVVPIVIQAPRAATPPSSGTSSVQVTTRTTSSRPGVTTTRVTVRDSTGAGRTVGPSPAGRTLATVSGRHALGPGHGGPPARAGRKRRPGPDAGDRRGRLAREPRARRPRTRGGLPDGRPCGSQTLIITSEAPIDAPIVILAP